MQILLIRHYPLSEGASMSAFADEIAAGLRGRGHIVKEFTSPVILGRLSRSHFLSKWLGYVDQFLIFPPILWFCAFLLPSDSLCVLADQALGPWLPWLAGRPHIVHCHDLLALEGALGLQPYHRIGWFGRQYQRLILSGFRKGKCFLSVSLATKIALESFLSRRPLLSEVLYNPLPSRFSVPPGNKTSVEVLEIFPGFEKNSFVFHIGRNWYKNRLGVLEIWEQLHILNNPLHLVLVGSLHSDMKTWIQQRPQLSPWLHVFDTANDELVILLYTYAAILLFPSHAEGFGWPILEALACGCPVITTNRPPMTEVGGEAITTIPPAPHPSEPLDSWAREAAQEIRKVLSRSPDEQERVRQLGYAQARCFQLEPWLDHLEIYYQQALDLQQKRP